MLNTYNQSNFTIRCEWGRRGVDVLAPLSDAVIIVDTLSFSTSVDIATSNDATVFPFFSTEITAQDYATEKDALLAGHNEEGYTLRPSSLVDIQAGTRLVLPSPNGSTLSSLTGGTLTFAGCLRNAQAVATAVQEQYQQITVIPAGERWKDDKTLRPALEDWLGAGAIIHYLQGDKSPEATSAEIAFLHYKDKLLETLQSIGSGIELIDKGYPQDVLLASQLNVSTAVPRLITRAYRSA